MAKVKRGLLRRIWNFIAGLFQKLEPGIKNAIDFAAKIVNEIKKIETDPGVDLLAEIIKRAIPGDADDALIEKARLAVREWVPKVLGELSFIDEVNSAEPDEKLRLILERLRLSSDETKNIVYHGLASLIIEKISDGELSWSDSTAIMEYYYKNILKKQ